MPKAYIEIDEEMMDKFMQHELEWHTRQMKRDLKACKKGRTTGVFSFDEKEERLELERHYQAMKLVAEYFGVDFKK